LLPRCEPSERPCLSGGTPAADEKQQTRRASRCGLGRIAYGIGTFEGAAAIRRFFEDWVGAYEEYRHEIVESRDLGNGVVFTVLNIVGRLAGSASGVRETWSWTATWVERMCERVVVRSDIDEARAAAERLAKERG
jgi:hypothetical protein